MRKFRTVAAAVVLGCVGAATADVGPIPAATLIAGTTMCEVDGWEYAPRWSQPDNGYVSPSLEDCAMDCTADAVCTGATYIVSGSDRNCWFKDWGTGPVAPPCLPPADSPNVYKAVIDPAGADCADITYMMTTIYDCEIEKDIEEKPDLEDLTPGAAPAAVTVDATVTDVADLAALTPSFSGFVGMDYSPTQTPPPAVAIVDINGGMGSSVATAVACAEACTAEALCNAASYYGDNPEADWPGGANCYLKTLTGCELPADATMTGDATIFMIGSGECADAPAAALATGLPAASPATPLGVAPPITPTAVAPVLPTAEPSPGFAPGPVAPLTTDGVAPDAVTDRSSGAPAPTESGAAAPTGATTDTVDSTSTPVVTAEDTSAAMGMLAGIAAAAVIGAALLL